MVWRGFKFMIVLGRRITESLELSPGAVPVSCHHSLPGSGCVIPYPHSPTNLRPNSVSSWRQRVLGPLYANLLPARAVGRFLRGVLGLRSAWVTG